MSNDKRILTVVVELQGEDGNWLWDAHINGPKNGVKVLSVADGNVVAERDRAYMELEYRDLMEMEDLDE